MIMKASSKDSDKLKEFSFEKYKFKQVTVTAGGLSYKGIFIGADDSDIYLKGTFRYLLLPLEKITSIHPDDEKEKFDQKKSIDKEFYSNPD